jgi:hypothetical protein
MAVKSQEKKASRREMLLERKVKEMEKELNETREMLDRHFMMQQAKRIKVFLTFSKKKKNIFHQLFPPIIFSFKINACLVRLGHSFCNNLTAIIININYTE